MTLASGTRVGPYSVAVQIGAGGMGEVYRARDTRLDRTVAIKVLTGGIAADAEARARFEDEARAIAALNHPHICIIYDVGRHGDLDYLAGEDAAAGAYKEPPELGAEAVVEPDNGVGAVQDEGLHHAVVPVDHPALSFQGAFDPRRGDPPRRCWSAP